MCGRMSLRVAVVLLGLALATPSAADEIWVAPTSQSDVGGIGVASNVLWPVTPRSAVRFAFSVPDNLQTFQAAKVVVVSDVTFASTTVSVLVCAASNSQTLTSNCSAAPVPHIVSTPANTLREIDISAALAPFVGAAGQRHLAVIAYTSPLAASTHLVGMRFTYAPTPPSGVATLGANTFTGTQTATAFVGDGSGLTNLPAPSGVASLDANTFTGTQTAPAFVGDGTGVSNVNAVLLDGLDSTAFAGAVHAHDVSQVAGAAGTGANTFTGTQTIDQGNLDLDASTASSGIITRDGAPFLHGFGISNVFLGLNAGNLTTTGAANTGLGAAALNENTNGGGNTAAGVGALLHNSEGNINTAMGWFALLNNSTGSGNTGIGNLALSSNSTGSNNVALGVNSGSSNTAGSNNIYVGTNVHGATDESNAMYLGRVGTQTKTVVAGVRGTSVTGGEMVVVDPDGRLGSAPVPAGNIGDITGVAAGTGLTGGGASGDVGVALDLTYTDARYATVLHGHNVSAISGAAALGANTFTGTQTLNSGNMDLDASTATTGNILKDGLSFLHDFGTGNTFLGRNAGNFSMTGHSNTAMGSFALPANTTGVDNTAIGTSALAHNAAGVLNTALGYSALASNTDGVANTAVGVQALVSNLSGAGNTAMGLASLIGATGNDNTGLGVEAGVDATSGSNNIYLGARVRGVAGESNTMYLGKVGTQGKTIIAGVRGVTTTVNDAIPVVIDSTGQLGTISSSARYKEDIHDLGGASRRLFDLRPVTFRYTQPFAGGAKPVQFGLIAEEVAQVFPELAVINADGQPETVKYQDLSVLLLNELQALHRQVQELKDEVERLRSATPLR